MHGLEPDEIGEYCSSRLKSAGMHEEIFTPAAIEAIHGITKGLPRLVNNLVTTCLILACGKKQRQIDEDVVYQAFRVAFAQKVYIDRRASGRP